VRRIVVVMQTTLNNRIGSSEFGVFWEPFPWGEPEQAWINEVFRRADTWAMSRRMFEAIVPWWEEIAAGRSPDDAVELHPADFDFAMIQHGLGNLYAIGNPPDYEPTPDRTVAAIAQARGADPLATLYDLMLEDDAGAMLMMPFFNYAEGNHDAIYDMISHPAAVSGLSDGGAHCGLICDASYPTYLLTHWARDRHRGPRFSLEHMVRKQTLDTATLFGLSDRGVIEVGKKADFNVIDMDALMLETPRMVYDLPAGGRRLVQGARGYDATVVSGVVTRRHGADTGARPGRLIRGVR